MLLAFLLNSMTDLDTCGYFKFLYIEKCYFASSSMRI